LLVVSIPSAAGITLVLCVSAVFASPADPVVSCAAVGPSFDVFLVYRCYFVPGFTAVAKVSAVAAFSTAVKVSSATDISNVTGVPIPSLPTFPTYLTYITYLIYLPKCSRGDGETKTTEAACEMEEAIEKDQLVGFTPRGSVEMVPCRRLL
jgi:hypothetical protein